MGINYAIVDDINNTQGLNHAGVVEGTIESYFEMYGNNGTISASAQFPSSNTNSFQVVYDTAMASSAMVENNSWGQPGVYYAEGAGYVIDKSNYYQHLYDAFLQNKTIVFAAGNSGNTLPGGTAIEASSPFELVVSAFDSNNQLAYYTNSNPGITDYVASGQAVGSLLFGTSFAAPRITALVGLLQYKFGNTLTQSEIRSVIDTYSKGEVLGQTNHQSQPQYVFHVVDDQAFSNILYANWTPGQVNAQMQAAGLYYLLLDRVADSGGQNWLAGIVTSQGIAAAANAIKASSEYQTLKQNPHAIDEVSMLSMIDAMYHTGLNREADDPGAAWWADHTLQTQTPTYSQVTTTGHHFDWHSIEQQFFAGAGVAMPSWLS